MDWQLLVYTIPLLVGALLLVIVATLAWQRRSQLMARYMMVMNALLAIYVAGYSMELRQTTVDGVQFWFPFEFSGAASVPAIFLMVIIVYTGRQHWLTLRTYFLLLVVPLVTVALAWTNDYHEWLWRDVALVESRGIYVADVAAGFWYWVFVAYVYVATSISALLLLRTYSNVSSLYQRQIRLLLVGVSLPLLAYVVNLLAIAGNLDIPPVNWETYALLVMALIYSWAVLRYHLLDIMPVAHHAVFESMEDGVIVMDDQRRVVDVNPAAAALLDWDRARVVGQNMPDFLLGHLRSSLQQAAKPQPNTEIMVADSMFDVSVSPLIQSGRHVSGHLVVLRDITERVKLIEELDAFAHTVAHDLKNPLALLLNYSAMLQDDNMPLSPNQTHEFLGYIGRYSQKMSSIVNELLLLAAVRQDDMILLESLDMAAVIAEAQGRLQMMIADRAAHISGPDDWPLVVGYGPWVEEVWANYLSNAIKYGGTPPRIILGYDVTDNGSVRFWVRDNGAGLSAEQQSGLFLPFTRLQTVRAKGHGLGLSIVRRIIERLGGTVGVESSPGTGSTFYFTLPREQPD